MSIPAGQAMFFYDVTVLWLYSVFGGSVEVAIGG